MPHTSIKRRKVFYIPGFDPRSARYYYNIYKRESAKWAMLCDKSIHVSNLDHSADLEATFAIENHTDKLICDYSILRWEDVILQHWRQPTHKLFFLMLSFYGSLYKNANWAYLKNHPSGPIKALLYPAIGVLISAILFASIFYLITSANSTETTSLVGISLFAGILAFIVCAYFFFLKIKSLWILRLLTFNHQQMPLKDSSFLHKMQLLSDHLVSVINTDHEQYDEILLIGHSYANTLMLILLQKSISQLDKNALKKFHPVSLGQLTPLVTCYKQATPIHDIIKQLAQETSKFTWLDISSPADGVCFYNCNPLAPIAHSSAINMVYKSPRFHKIYSTENYQTLKKDKFNLHFQYLYCADKNSPTNYFQMTAGDKPIESIY